MADKRTLELFYTRYHKEVTIDNFENDEKLVPDELTARIDRLSNIPDDVLQKLSQVWKEHND